MDGKEASLVLDAGDLLYQTTSLPEGQREAANVAADALVAELARTKVASLVPGERDLAAGMPAYVKRVTEAKLPMLAANLLDKTTGKRPFPGRRVVTVGGVKVGLAGVVAKAPFERVADVQVHPPLAEAAAAELKALHAEGAQLFVLLAHDSARHLKDALPAENGWNVIVTGHDRRGRREAERIGDALVVSGGDRGRQVGHLALDLEGEPPWSKLSNAGEVAALEEELRRMVDRRKYYERMMGREGLKEQSKTFYGQRLAQLDKDKLDTQTKLDAAKDAPKAGNRYELAMAPMDARIPDDPACAAALAPAVQRLAVLKPKGAHGGHGDHSGHDHPPGHGHDHGPGVGHGAPSGVSKVLKTTGVRRPARASPAPAPSGAGR